MQQGGKRGHTHTGHLFLADVLAHGRDLHVHVAVGAFDGGQQARQIVVRHHSTRSLVNTSARVSIDIHTANHEPVHATLSGLHVSDLASTEADNGCRLQPRLHEAEGIAGARAKYSQVEQKQ